MKEKTEIAELEAKATFILEKQNAEKQSKMLEIQGEFTGAKSRARVYENYNQMEVNVDREADEVECNVMWKTCNKKRGIQIKDSKNLKQTLKIINQMSRVC